MLTSNVNPILSLQTSLKGLQKDPHPYYYLIIGKKSPPTTLNKVAQFTQT